MANLSKAAVGRRVAVLTAAPLLFGLATPLAAQAATTGVESTSVSPSTISAGEEALQKVTLTEPAPAGGTVVALRDLNEFEDPNYARSTGRKVTVPEGQRSVTFPIRVQSEDTTTVTSLEASANGTAARTAITVEPPDWREQVVTGFWVKQQYGQAIALTGTTVTGTVQIKSPAPVGGLAVDIRNNPVWNDTAYSAPYVVVPAGATGATFPISVSTDQNPRYVQMTADLGNDKATSSLIGTPKKFSVGTVREIRNKSGYWPNYGVVGLGDIWHPFGAVIKLTSDTPGVTVPPELQLSSSELGRTFPIQVDPSTPIGTKVKITATWVLGPAPVTTEITIQD
ncbi:hypothetical protein [Actinomadura sp. K4S16]|uniref:hypothetical protein n=1 Tax=Actinomadura sp. K4S16 TaxID=1316147 RepID=UPI0011EEC6AD|nr:hypothetical protein [Actinomadura sp. K4S16]